MGRPRTPTSSLGSHALLWVAAFLVALAPLGRAPDALHDHTNHAVTAHACLGGVHVSGEGEGEGPHRCLSCDPALAVGWATLSSPSWSADAPRLDAWRGLACGSAVPSHRPGPPPARGPPAV